MIFYHKVRRKSTTKSLKTFLTKVVLLPQNIDVTMFCFTYHVKPIVLKDHHLNFAQNWVHEEKIKQVLIKNNVCAILKSKLEQILFYFAYCLSWTGNDTKT